MSGEEVSFLSGEESDYSDPEGFVDTITDEELLGDILKQRPVEDTDLDNIIVVDNAPKVGPDRLDRLKTVLKKIFSKFGNIVTEYYPVDENNIFKGYFFMEYLNAKQAAEAVKTCDGYRLDKSHNFSVNLFTDFEKFADLTEDWSPPRKTEFVDVGNLRSWLLNENCYDQYSVIYGPQGNGETTAICWNTPYEPEIIMERLRWSATYLQWSPLGTYLTTFHVPGVQLWGGENFDSLAKFEQEKVQLVDFSPCERYIVTFSNVVENPEDPQNVIIWDIKTGLKKRTFARSPKEEWPVIKWSHDDYYFARKGENVLSIYETPSFGLLEKKSIVAKGIRDFMWSPVDNLIAYWVPEQNEIPTKIIITSIPSKKEVSTKSRHLVSDCKLQWHKQGTFLCVKVDHFLNKSRKQLCSSFEIFHTKEALIPVDSIEVKDPVRAFSLEPNGTKLAVIHGEPPTRISVTFYDIKEKGNPPVAIKTFRNQLANNIFWCPTGQFVVLAQLKSMDGALDFIDTADMTLMNRQEHTKVSDLAWDPTGRYVVSSLSYWSEKMDTGFIVWSFQGRLLYRSSHMMDRFCQLQWRPRPPPILIEEDMRLIKKDFKRYQYEFEQKDRTKKTKASKDVIFKRQQQVNEFRQFRMRKLREVEEKRKKFLDYDDILNSVLAESLEIIEVETLEKEDIS